MVNTTKTRSEQVDFTDNAVIADEFEATTSIDTPSLELGGVAVTASAAEINLAADNSANVEVVSSANVITAAESGKTFFLNSATGFANTLPAPGAGLRYTFIVSTVPTSGNTTVVTDSGDNVIEGAADVNSSLVLAANEDSINFVASTCLVGDRVSVISDGTSWFVDGFSGAGGGITFTAT